MPRPDFNQIWKALVIERKSNIIWQELDSAVEVTMWASDYNTANTQAYLQWTYRYVDGRIAYSSINGKVNEQHKFNQEFTETALRAKNSKRK